MADAHQPVPTPLRRRFEAVIFDWDGTAVARRSDDATGLRRLIERLCDQGLELAIVTGTSIETIDAQLRARPTGPGTLLAACNRGSELFRLGSAGPELIAGRSATTAEDAALDAAAHAIQERLNELGLDTEIVATRLNRRKIDLIPVDAWRDPPKAEIATLLRAVQARLAATDVESLTAAVAIAREIARTFGLPDARITSDAKHIELGLTDKGDSVHAIAERWWNAGIGAGLVLAAGDEFGPLGGVPGSDAHLLAVGSGITAVSVGAEPEGVPPQVARMDGGPAAFATLLEDQSRRRTAGQLPGIDVRPGWSISFLPADANAARADEARTALGDGTIGMRGKPLHGSASDIAAMQVAGAYTGEGPETTLLETPEIAAAIDPPEQPSALTLDLRTGVLHEANPESGTAGVRFVAADPPGTIIVRDQTPTPPSCFVGGSIASSTADAREETATTSDGRTQVTANGLARDHPDAGTVDRFLAFATDAGQARTRAHQAAADGFDLQLARRRAATAMRWRDADITCTGDPDVQLAIRFALFHLMQAAADADESGVAARGLTGPAYRGHVFWDADVFVLPFMAATHPRAARSMLEYRVRRLDAARAAARDAGYRGAHFPWESADQGHDVTPAFARDRAGRVIPIRNGLLEQHIVADVAWAVQHYLAWTGDVAFAADGGQRLLVETARFWASRVRTGDDGRGHIYGVIGPDEYHEPIDDNAYTNVMARENLQWAADNVDRFPTSDVTADEVKQWRALAGILADGYDPDRGLYEQFSGFFDLEPLIIAEVAPRRPIAADLLLGRERLATAQVVKQADVLMLFHLVPEAVATNTLVANLRFYEPRTAHGSSLSPGIHAALLARTGDTGPALDLLRLAGRVDLDDITDTTALGLHLGAMGSVWQACVFGFLGCRPTSNGLRIDPAVPSELDTLGSTVRFVGTRISIAATHDTLTVDADAPVTLIVNETVVAHPGRRRTWQRRNNRWEPHP